MGYCMSMYDCEFHIPAANFAGALSAIKSLMKDEDKMDGCEYKSGGVTGRWYAWVNTSAVLEAETLSDALYAWRWEAHFSENGNVSYLHFLGEKSGQDDVLFRALAPYVTSGSFVAMRGEDGAIWRWYFDGNKCIEQNAVITFQ